MKGAKPIPVPNFLSLAVCLVLELHIELCHPLTNIKLFFFFFTAGGIMTETCLVSFGNG